MTAAVGPEAWLDAGSSGGPAFSRLVEAETGTVAASISWVSARSEYWPDADQSEVPSGQNALEPVLGVACLVFGVGVGGSGWVDRLVRSGWFAGLEP